MSRLRISLAFVVREASFLGSQFYCDGFQDYWLGNLKFSLKSIAFSSEEAILSSLLNEISWFQTIF